MRKLKFLLFFSDMFKVNFILEAYTAENEEFLKTFVEQAEANQVAATASKSVVLAVDSQGNSSKPLDPMEREIQKVLDVLPHLESDFVRRLLPRYENTELAIAAVLEGNLPPDLDNTVEPLNETNQSSNAVETITNLMNQIDCGIDETTKITSKAAKMQPIRQRAEKQILNDKSHLKDLRARYQEYDYISDGDEYDDEYDDSYDAMTESETKSVARIMKMTGAINDIVDEIDDSDESDSNEQNGTQARDTSRDFCENPEAVRERWARNRQAKFGNRSQPKAPE